MNRDFCFVLFSEIHDEEEEYEENEGRAVQCCCVVKKKDVNNVPGAIVHVILVKGFTQWLLQLYFNFCVVYCFTVQLLFSFFLLVFFFPLPLVKPAG